MSIKKLGSVSKIRRGASPRPIDDPKYFGGDVGWIRISDVSASNKYLKKTTQYVSELGEKNSVRVNKGDLILTICGTVGRPIIIDIPACIHDGFVQIYDLKDSDSEFLYYNLQFSEDRLKGKGQSGTQTNLNTSIVGDLEIFHPPLKEQTLIARVLSKIDSAIEQTQKLIEKQKRIKQGLMQDLLTKGIDGHGNIRSEKTHPFKNSSLGRVPEEWNALPVFEIGSVKVGRQRSPKYQTGKFTTPYLRVANVFDGFFDFSDVLEMDFTPDEKVTFSVLKGDIFLNEGQTLELVGRNAIYEGEDNKYCFQNSLIRFRSFQTNNPYFCKQVFKYFLDTGKFMDVAKQTTSVAHLGTNRFAEMFFPRPELAEQNKIANTLKSHDDLTNNIQIHLSKLGVMKKGLMQGLLTGKTRVNNLISEKINTSQTF